MVMTICDVKFTMFYILKVELQNKQILICYFYLSHTEPWNALITLNTFTIKQHELKINIS